VCRAERTERLKAKALFPQLANDARRGSCALMLLYELDYRPSDLAAVLQEFWRDA